MPEPTPSTPMTTEPNRRFYPSQGETFPVRPPVYINRTTPTAGLSVLQKNDDVSYLSHRHPILLQRLYSAVDTHLDTYSKQTFLYDAYPDYLSLHLLRGHAVRREANAFRCAEYVQWPVLYRLCGPVCSNKLVNHPCYCCVFDFPEEVYRRCFCICCKGLI